jgi:hypothetical protein
MYIWSVCLANPVFVTCEQMWSICSARLLKHFVSHQSTHISAHDSYRPNGEIALTRSWHSVQWPNKSVHVSHNAASRTDRRCWTDDLEVDLQDLATVNRMPRGLDRVNWDKGFGVRGAIIRVNLRIKCSCHACTVTPCRTYPNAQPTYPQSSFRALFIICCNNYIRFNIILS